MASGVLFLARLPTPAPSPVAATPRGRVVRTVATDAVAGMRWLWRARFVRTVVLTGSALTFFTMAWEATLVLPARGPMGVSETGCGVMLMLAIVGPLRSYRPVTPLRV
ncbi:hypothetical protein [Streptomyces tubercidicus]